MAQAGYRHIDCARSYGNEKEVRVQRHGASCYTHTAEKFKGLALFLQHSSPFSGRVGSEESISGWHR
jgi:hypothetical protein